MNARLLIIGMISGYLLMSPASFAQKNVKPPAQSADRQKEWKQVDSLSDQGLPKSAMAIVDKIYVASKRGNDIPQFIKAIIYKIKLNSFFREDFLVGTIHDLEDEVKQAQEPSKQILQSILAEVYSRYYENNQYRFNDRTRLADVRADSLQTWDGNTLIKVIYSNYLASLQNDKLLKSIAILDYREFVEIPESSARKGSSKNDPERMAIFRPTLYDFLANRALDYFTSSEGPKNKSAFGFLLDNPGYFSQTDGFVKLVLPTNDSLSQDLQAIKIYQALESFHMNDNNPAALIDATLLRLAFVKDKAVTGNNDSLYLDALKKFENHFENSPWSANISFTIAQFLQLQGDLKARDPGHKYDINKALEICESTLKRYPESEGAKNCRVLAENLKNKEIEIKNESVIPPGNPSLLLIEYRNLLKVYIRLYNVEQDIWESKKEKLKKEEIVEFFAAQQVFKSLAPSLPDFGDYKNHSVEIMLPGTKPGLYVLLACSDSAFSNSSKLITWSEYRVSSINYISKRNKNGSIGLYIFNRESGLPMHGIRVEAWTKNYNYKSSRWESRLLNSFSSDTNGFVTLPPLEKGAKFNNLFCKLITDEDVLNTSNFYQYPVSPAVARAEKHTTFFTDRAIYRPGQTVYFKGIIIEKKEEQLRLITHETSKVTYTDVNGRKIAEQSFTTNDFGSFNGSFIAPTDVLPGQMYISNESGNVSFSVEQYKRPTFEIIFNPLEGNYKLNEILTVKGKAMAFAGNALSQAKVRYRVVRNARFPWWEWWYIPFPSSPETEIANGTVKTAQDGSFNFSFRAVPDFSLAKSANPVFDFNVTADVTDINGESQSLEQSVSVGYQSLLLSVNVPDKLNLTADSLLKFNATNLNGKSTPAKVTVKISKLKVPDGVFLKRYWQKPDTSLFTEKQFHESFPNFSYGNEGDTATWNSVATIMNKVINLPSDSVINIIRFADSAGKTHWLESGVYEILLSADDPFGEKVRLKRFFTVYDPVSATLPGNPVNWFVPLKTTAKPGETVWFLVGSREKNVTMMYEIYAADSLVSRRWFTISNFQMPVGVPVAETYRGNFSINIVFSKFNRIFQNSQLIAVPRIDNKLNIVFETFRSKILPGQKEQWKIHITNPGKMPVSAEFLASMYDASLDAFRPNKWSFYISGKFFGTNPWDIGSSYFYRSSSALGTLSSSAYTEHQYPRLNWFGMNYFGGRQYPMLLKSGRVDHKVLMETVTEMVAPEKMNGEAPPPPENMPVAGLEKPKDEKIKTSVEKPVFQIRRDFRETAFFYPDLVTDSSGGISLSFTAPESLTRWKFQGFAHTQQLEYNQIEKELVTRKDLMVMPNAPRFVRQGDQLVLSTKVINLSEQDLKTWVHIELFDGISMKPMDSLVSQPGKLEVTIPLGESIEVSWNIRIPDNPSLSLLQYRIIAESGTFSDGEEKIIPVLPNRMMVTETLPLPVRDKGTFDFSFDKLFTSSADKTLKNYRLTLEFASNPVWYAIQALPALNEKQYEDAYSAFSAFYSNSIAAHIMNSDPKIKAVFESWKNLTPDALLSNLEKNAQLKSLLLQQTPWVAEAQTETDNRRKLGMYFDPDNIQANLNKNLSRLQKLQTPNGGWTWFEGMPENRFISQDIICGLAHLGHLGVEISGGDPRIKQMVLKGVQYMDEAFIKNYNELKRRYPGQMKDDNLSVLEIQYLYARSFFLQSQPLPSNLTEALNYYLDQASKYWTKEGLSAQAMLALALDRFGKKDVSALIIKSLSERALHSQEMGMYWAQVGGYFWHQAPVETQALLIEAFDEVAKDSKAVDEMKIWLLKQKQTQSWKSARATVEACYALLLRGTNLLSEDPKIKITLGKEKIDPSKLTDIRKEAGTGYFQMSWSGNEISPEMGNIKVSKASEGVAWGALYWQYFEDLDKITTAATNLKLEKKVFLEKNTSTGPVLEAVLNNGKLQVGNKLKVRVVLTTDRDLEFVHMRDQRASAFEPYADKAVSGYRYQDGLGYYQSTSDASTDFFFDFIPRGTYVFEYPLVVNASGDYSNGITTIQCLYAPEFSAHSEGIRVVVGK